MIKIHTINLEQMDHLQPLYDRFCQRSKTDYQWSEEPVTFEKLCIAFRTGQLFGYWLEESTTESPIGLMLCRLEAHRAIEINLLYCEVDDRKTVLDRAIRQFIRDIRQRDDWDVVSYPMLGEQSHFIRSIMWYGFRPVGQAILKFDLLDSIMVQIMAQQKPEYPGPEYTIDTWKPEYAGGVAKSIYEAFHDATDSYWDPRFRTELGARHVVGLLSNSLMGKFLPDCTSVALHNGEPVGFCFLLQTGTITGNIPLVGVSPAQKGKGLGNLLLKNTLMNCLQAVLAEQLNIFSVDTTTDTDNIAAIKMYRRMGFQEEHNYPHVYLTRERAMAFQERIWC
jgi:ribosomal protein S18 acetylase RimI-like enzyme